MSKLAAKLHSLGVAQSTRHVLPKLALEVALAAARGEIDASSALDVYIDYYKAASRLKTIDPYDNGVKVNVSKLRQIIKAKDPELLSRVTAAHAKLTLKDIPCRPLYQAMVNGCRKQLEQHKKLTRAQIIGLCKR